MVVAIRPRRRYQQGMPAERIAELETQLVTANESVATLTKQNAELTTHLAEAEMRNKKLRRTSRRDESSFKEQLAVALSRRG